MPCASVSDLNKNLNVGVNSIQRGSSIAKDHSVNSFDLYNLKNNVTCLAYFILY